MTRMRRVLCFGADERVARRDELGRTPGVLGDVYEYRWQFGWDERWRWVNHPICTHGSLELALVQYAADVAIFH